MDDLNEYLKRTKIQREKSKLLAQSILENTLRYNFRLDIKNEQEFPSFSPKRFQEFEERTRMKLKEILSNSKLSLQRTPKNRINFENKVSVIKSLYIKKKSKPRPTVYLPLKNQSSLSKNYYPVDKSLKIASDSSQDKYSENCSRARSELKKIYLKPILNNSM